MVKRTTAKNGIKLGTFASQISNNEIGTAIINTYKIHASTNTFRNEF